MATGGHPLGDGWVDSGDPSFRFHHDDLTLSELGTAYLIDFDFDLGERGETAQGWRAPNAKRSWHF